MLGTDVTAEDPAMQARIGVRFEEDLRRHPLLVRPSGQDSVHRKQEHLMSLARGWLRF